jgi:hypothetical protein
MKSFIIYLVLFLSFFGPKIGVVDFMVVGGLLGLLIVYKSKLEMPKELLVLLSILVVYTAYSTFVFLLTYSTDDYILKRCYRILVTTTLLGLIFSNTRFPTGRLINIIIILLLINAGTVIVQIFVPASKKYFVDLYEITKDNPLRASGLSSGYEGAGLLNVMGSILAGLVLYYDSSKARYFVALMVFTVGALFTARTTMVLSILIAFLVSCTVIYKGKGFGRLVASCGFGFVAVVFLIFVYPLLVSTINQFENLPEAPAVIASTVLGDEIGESYTSATVGELQSMWNVTMETTNFFFGYGSSPSHIDVGYIKVVYMTGLTGLFMVLSAYIYILWKLKRVYPKSDHGCDPHGGKSEKIGILSLAMMIVIVFILDLKNLYFFSRSISELIIVMFFSLLNEFKGKTLAGGLEYT